MRMQEDREACMAAGMDDYISKPMRLEQLAQVLAQCQPYNRSSEVKGCELLPTQRRRLEINLR